MMTCDRFCRRTIPSPDPCTLAALLPLTSEDPTCTPSVTAAQMQVVHFDALPLKEIERTFSSTTSWGYPTWYKVNSWFHLNKHQLKFRHCKWNFAFPLNAQHRKGLETGELGVMLLKAASRKSCHKAKTNISRHGHRCPACCKGFLLHDI